MLAHELRNPLAPIRTAVELLQSGHAPRETRGRALAAADRQLMNITRLVDDLLDVSRITTGKIELRRSTVELSDIIEAAVETAGKIMQERGHALTVSLPDEPVILDGDPTRLTQVFANLLHNAAKYTDPGGTISVCGAVEGAEVTIGVIDNGLGIRAELVPRVFDLFVQEDSGADRARGGLGLGLTLVRELVSMHGGNVTVESEGLGKGSTFTVRLPCKTPQKIEPPARGANGASTIHDVAHPHLAPLRIVLVEDSDDIREMLMELLQLEGHTVEVANDGLQGVSLVLEKQPQVALIDIGLPGLDGYAVAQRVRAAQAPIRLIAMTGYGQPEERQRALDAGFDAHLVKPVSLHDLSVVLKRLC
jgi:CheY-like chemotaxis protein/two-component sensor histidine kinase